ncbi:hypothetical protein VKT23_015804 [Stygiomarasmius scandens]|uniref:Uncharacterized protein n=1 Tax=Marasmiellus scandens TaxID=2682957 RepID=A0ABR1IWJ6_9AGAR
MKEEGRDRKGVGLDPEKEDSGDAFALVKPEEVPKQDLGRKESWIESAISSVVDILIKGVSETDLEVEKLLESTCKLTHLPVAILLQYAVTRPSWLLERRVTGAR